MYVQTFFFDDAFLFLIQEKDKKKGKSKNKATNNNNQEENESKREDKQGQAMRPEYVTALNPDLKKETRKSILPGVKGTSTPGALPPIEKQKKKPPSSKGAVPRRKITPQGPPQVST